MAKLKPTTFYRTGDGVLARSRDGGTMTPEVMHEGSQQWSSYPSLDVYTDARKILRSDAAGMLPAGLAESSLDAAQPEVPSAGG